MPDSRRAPVLVKTLRTAQQKKLIVTFARPFELGTFTGYVLDAGLRFFLLAALSDGFEFEQYTFIRVADVRRLQCPAKHAKFYADARWIRRDKMPPKINVNLT